MAKMKEIETLIQSLEGYNLTPEQIVGWIASYLWNVSPGLNYSIEDALKSAQYLYDAARPKEE